MSPANGLSFLLLLLDVGGAVAVVLVQVLVLVLVLVRVLTAVDGERSRAVPRVPSARHPLCRCAFSRMAVTKVSFNWCQRCKKHPAHPARSNFVSRSIFLVAKTILHWFLWTRRRSNFRSTFKVTKLLTTLDGNYSGRPRGKKHVRNLERGRGGVCGGCIPEETFVTA